MQTAGSSFLFIVMLILTFHYLNNLNNLLVMIKPYEEQN